MQLIEKGLVMQPMEIQLERPRVDRLLEPYRKTIG